MFNVVSFNQFQVSSFEFQVESTAHGQHSVYFG